MAFVYSARREKIELVPADGIIGVRFTDTASAVSAFKTGVKATASHAIGRFGSVMMMHAANALDMPLASIFNTLPTRESRNVERTLPAFIEPRSKLRLVATEEISVRFKQGVASSKRDKTLADLGLAIARSADNAPRQHIVVPISMRSGYRTLDLANNLSEREDVVDFASPNFLTEYRKSAVPKPTKQWHLENTGKSGAVANEDVRARGAWAVTPGGDPRIVIAVIDDGVDLSHRSLKDNIWVNPDPAALDRHGRDFQDANSPYDPSARVFVPPYDDFNQNDIHGTCCAGVAAGSGKGDVYGLAYACKILAVKIFGGSSLAPMSSIADAIRYAGTIADVISCSWGVPEHADIERAIDDVVADGRKKKGCVVFVATGNENASSIGFPSSHPKVVAVGASNDQGVRSGYSNYGDGITLVAPSGDNGRTGIFTSDVSTPNRGFNLNADTYDDFSGTSSATPLAAAAGALVLSVKPSLKWDDVRSILTDSADKIDKAGAAYKSGYSKKYGYGRVNAEAAVTKAAGGQRAAAPAPPAKAAHTVGSPSGARRAGRRSRPSR